MDADQADATDRSPRRHRARAAAVLVVIAGSVGTGGVLAAPPAEAHPFGAPQTATLSLADPATVRVRWQVGALDDLSYLAAALGALPADRTMLDGAVAVEPDDPDVLARSGRLEPYLLRHVAVRTADGGCAGTVAPLGDVRADGAVIDFACPAPVTTATVEITTLADLSTLYTTLVTGPDGQRVAYGGSQTSRVWHLAGPARPGGATPSSVVASHSAASSGDRPGRATDRRVAALPVAAAAGLSAAGLAAFLHRRRAARRAGT